MYGCEKGQCDNVDHADDIGMMAMPMTMTRMLHTMIQLMIVVTMMTIMVHLMINNIAQSYYADAGDDD